MEPDPADLRVYSTLTRDKQPFEPLEEGRVRMYVCGPTVYDHSHIGHGRSYVAFDVVRRYLEFLGYDVTYTVNFTDVEDKIFERARELDVTSEELTRRYEDSFREDMAALHVREADHHPRVTEVIPEIIEVVEGLIDAGVAYESEGDVYFEVGSFEDFGKLSHQDIEELIAGKRVEVSEKKRHPLDFALWKATKEGEDLHWDSPWGQGRPGWHIECSVMAMTTLGDQIDVHGGGMDLVFPHHESEIMQSESYTGVSPFARYWLHNGFITINEEKMSKSLGNFFTIKEVLGKYDPETVRFFLVNTHYRKPIDFSDDHLEEARQSYQRLKNTLESLCAAQKASHGTDEALEERLVDACRKGREAFHAAMLDDFNTRQALASLFDFAREVNAVLTETIHLDPDVLQGCIDHFHDVGDILGLFEHVADREEDVVDELVRLLIDVRERARDEGDFETADAIRDRLAEAGIALEDRKDGTVWKWER